ncbi:PIF1-like helicase [Senna tora]|uniref:ATP-dependent DNA helicase n=1 Tax=Senna tora TaxID=362788 RepID=A0A834WD46_9FABA|nr:PIF1-like helicase [Senna tora]
MTRSTLMALMKLAGGLLEQTWMHLSDDILIKERHRLCNLVASSGIASQLIPGGRTVHSRFGIPLDCNENSTCNIMQGNWRWIGDVLNDEEKEITIPADILINNVVDPIQSIVDSTFPSFIYHFCKESTNLSFDSISNQNQDSELADVYTTEFINTINGSRLPYNHLKLKVTYHVTLEY